MNSNPCAPAALLFVVPPSCRQTLIAKGFRTLAAPENDHDRDRIARYVQWAKPSRILIGFNPSTGARAGAERLALRLAKHAADTRAVPAGELADAAGAGAAAVLVLALASGLVTADRMAG